MRKQRTRQHIIEDLSFNHVERQVLYGGHVFRRTINTFNERGETENFFMSFQLKSTDNIQYSNPKAGFVFDLSKQDLELWLYSMNPVLIILFDAQKEIAYFIDLQAYFKKNRIVLKNVRKFVRIYFSQTAIFDTKAVQDLRTSLK
jgi:hypothetical protein